MTTEAHRVAIRRLAALRAASASYLGYLQFLYPKRVYAPFQLTLIDALDKLERRVLLHPDTGQPVRNVLITMPPRHGKLCADDTPVLTTGGWKRHGDLRVGDFVFHPSGSAVAVIAVHRPAQASLRVTLTDGSHVDVHPSHEWTVFDRASGCWRTIETAGIAAQKYWAGGRARFQLPRVSPLSPPSTPLPIAPYTLGAWLGDGSCVKDYITGVDTEVFDAVQRDGYPARHTWRHARTGVLTVAFGSPEASSTGRGQRQSDLRFALKKLGILSNKRIPAAYFTASLDDRLELLAGLVDTDGHVSPTTGRVRISTASATLAEDIASLIATFGWRSSLSAFSDARTGRAITSRRAIYQVGFQPSLRLPVRIPRKAIRRHAPQRLLGIRSIAPITPTPGRCITVAADDGLYLVGRRLTPTHNSEYGTVNFPAYFLGRDPRRFVMCSSYNGVLAKSFGRKVRDICEGADHHAVFPDFAVSSDSRAADLWSMDAGGQYFGIGLAGTTSGRPANLLVIDDPFKSRVDADSMTTRNQVWDFYTSALDTRLQPEIDGALPIQLIIMTRWHPDDLAGRIMQLDEWKQGHWLHIDFPALTQTPGSEPPVFEALWPERFPVTELLRKRARNEREFESLYQQRPYVLGGNMIKTEWWRSYEEPDPAYMSVIITADTAFKKESYTDPTVIMVLGLTRAGDIHILDVLRGRWEFPELKRRLIALNALWRGKALRAIYIEEKASGIPLIQELRRESGLSVIPHRVVFDKASRTSAVLPLIEGGRVYLPTRASWLDDFVAECASFPSGTHDDQVDALTMGLDVLSRTAISPEMIELSFDIHQSLMSNPQLGRNSLSDILGASSLPIWGE